MSTFADGCGQPKRKALPAGRQPRALRRLETKLLLRRSFEWLARDFLGQLGSLNIPSHNRVKVVSIRDAPGSGDHVRAGAPTRSTFSMIGSLRQISRFIVSGEPPPRREIMEYQLASCDTVRSSTKRVTSARRSAGLSGRPPITAAIDSLISGLWSSSGARAGRRLGRPKHDVPRGACHRFGGKQKLPDVGKRRVSGVTWLFWTASTQRPSWDCGALRIIDFSKRQIDGHLSIFSDGIESLDASDCCVKCRQSRFRGGLQFQGGLARALRDFWWDDQAFPNRNERPR